MNSGTNEPWKDGNHYCNCLLNYLLTLLGVFEPPFPEIVLIIFVSFSGP